jgi:hypothetical protein
MLYPLYRIFSNLAHKYMNLKALSLSMVIALFGPLHSQSLSPMSPENHKRSVFLSLGFSPDLNNRHLSSSSNDPFVHDIIRMRNSNENRLMGYTTQLNLAVSMSPKTSIEMGLGYRNMGYSSFNVNIMTENSFYIGDIYDRFHYWAIPLNFRQTFGKRKWQLTYHVGMSANFFRFQKSQIISVSDPSQPNITRKNMDGKSTYSRFNLIPSIGLGATYNINSKSKISIEPTFRYSLFSLTDNTPIEGYLYNTGVNLTYQLKLN